MSKIEKAFANGKAFIAFLTCGDPDLKTTGKTIVELEKAGCDLIELGIPFSDPTAEGPVIQAADERALAGGVTTKKIMDFIREIRKTVTVPMVYMTYANVVYSYGIEAFAKECVEIGIDGIILPDVPYEEADEFRPICRRYGVDFISFIAPTSKERIAEIAKDADGFIYVISSLGVTGVRSEITTDIGEITSMIRQTTHTPCAVGFGISTPEQAKRMAAVSDGVIVGSAIVKILAEHKTDAPALVGAYAKKMKEAVLEVS